MDRICRFGHVDVLKPAFFAGGQTISYGRFANDIDALVIWLANQGVAEGQRLGIYMRHPYWAWACLLAAMRMGLTHAVLTPNFREEIVAAGRFDVVLGEVDDGLTPDLVSRTIFFSPKNMEPLTEQTGGVLAEYLRIAPRVESGLSGHLIFTSGTTGKPKAVLLSPDTLLKRVEGVLKSQSLTADTRLLSMLGMDTIGGLRYPLATWRAGGCVMYGLPLPGKMKLGNIPYLRSNLLLTSPPRLRALLNRTPKLWGGRDDRRIIVVGSRLPVLLRNAALVHACCRVSIVYGATETGSIAVGEAGLLDRHPGAVGFAVDGACVQIVDQEGRPRQAGEKGIVRTRTTQMVSRYEGEPECNPEDVFRDGWFYPGDEGVLFQDGLLAITGRISEVLNIEGLKVSLLDCESKLEKMPEIEDVCATVLRLDVGDRLILAVVCAETVDLRELSQKIRVCLPVGGSHIVLRVPAIPRNARGKLERNLLAEKLLKLYRRSRATLSMV